MGDLKTPLLDELERGPWPSFVKDLKQLAERKPAVRDALAQLEQSYEDKIGHWKHGGIVGVRGYGGGVIGRYSDSPDRFPHVAEFHTLRVNQPSGWFYTTKALRTLCDIWEGFGSGMTNFHGATGDIILLGAPTQNLQPCFDALSEAGFDLGGSGSDLRTPSACVGPARCEYACLDTLGLLHDITNTFQDELHRPMWPYKFKIKIAGCGNDCVAAVARADLSVIGTWRDALRIDQEAVREYVAGGLDIDRAVCDRCPPRALRWDAGARELKLKAEECTRCMHCINVMPKAVRPGLDKGATVLIGSKATILQTAFLSWVIVPFMKMEPPYTELKDLLRKIWEWWDENAKTRERVGELIYRKGMREFLRAVGLPAVPQMVFRPRANPYFFWWPEELAQ
ncbi:MAG TPA: dissimilatory-type sulfite reductase subunit alpha [Firmicutes bacterium]|nr:dissimilatory-type sulfite reductase subunit alpha [Bacillota bacterium]